MQETSIPGSGRSPREGNQLPTPVFWPGEFHGQRSLGTTVLKVSESDTTERLALSVFKEKTWEQQDAFVGMQRNEQLSGSQVLWPDFNFYQWGILKKNNNRKQLRSSIDFKVTTVTFTPSTYFHSPCLKDQVMNMHIIQSSPWSWVLVLLVAFKRRRAELSARGIFL